MNHEALDDAVENDVVVFAGGCECSEILAGLEACQHVKVLFCTTPWEHYLRGLILEQGNGDVAEGGVKDYTFCAVWVSP